LKEEGDGAKFLSFDFIQITAISSTLKRFFIKSSAGFQFSVIDDNIAKGWYFGWMTGDAALSIWFQFE
jgi:hypothetical protein